MESLQAPNEPIPRETVIAFVTNGRKLLMVRHNYSDSPRDAWSMVQGGREPDESLTDTAIRETWEEANLNIPDFDVDIVENPVKGFRANNVKGVDKIYKSVLFFLPCGEFPRVIGQPDQHIAEAKALNLDECIWMLNRRKGSITSEKGRMLSKTVPIIGELAAKRFFASRQFV